MLPLRTSRATFCTQIALWPAEPRFASLLPVIAEGKNFLRLCSNFLNVNTGAVCVCALECRFSFSVLVSERKLGLHRRPKRIAVATNTGWFVVRRALEIAMHVCSISGFKSFWSGGNALVGTTVALGRNLRIPVFLSGWTQILLDFGLVIRLEYYFYFIL